MSESYKDEGKKFAEFMASLSDDEREEANLINARRAADEFRRFKLAFDKQHCYLCGKPLQTFSRDSPCIHWLLKPKGFKNKDIDLLGDKYGYFQIQSLLRWYANQDSYAKNINDLSDEGTGKLFEVTIRYKNLEWAFSCSESDYEGHAGARNGNYPHYHFQMRIDKRPFIKYNNNHMPFSKMDILTIEAMKAKPDRIKQRFSYGDGMSEMFSSDVLDEVLSGVSQTPDEEDAAFSIDTFVMAEEGQTIKGDDVYALIQKAKDKGVTVASLINELPGAQGTVTVSPGPGVVDQAPRSGGKGGT